MRYIQYVFIGGAIGLWLPLVGEYVARALEPYAEAFNNSRPGQAFAKAWWPAVEALEATWGLIRGAVHRLMRWR